MTTITALPSAPSRADPTTFSAKSDALLGALDQFVTETNAVAGEVNANATIATTQAGLATTNGAAQVALAAAQVSLATDQVALATTQAGIATTQATAAAASALVAGATLWVSGTTYAIGNARYSPANGQTYRRLTAGAGTTDPSADTTNWVIVNGITSEAILLTTNNLPTVRPTLNLDFANSKIVDPRITFTRASTATRINQNGLIETVASGAARIDYDPVTLACKGLLVEESRTNLLTYSEQFDNAAWVKGGASILANAAIAPDGKMTADKLVENTAASTAHFIAQNCSLTSGQPYTITCFLAAAGRSECMIGFDPGSVFSTHQYARFNLLTGTGSALLGSPTFSIASVGGGLFRCSVTATAVTTGWTTFSLQPHNGTSNVYTGDGTSGIYLFGAQLEAGAFATSYIPSAQTFTGRASTATYIGSNGLIQSAGSGVARYQYNPLNLTVAPFLLLEAAATNLLTYSQEFDNAAWVEASGAGTSTVTPNTTAAPDGTTSADTITDADAGNRLSRVQNVSVVNDSVTRTFSVFIKKTTGATSFPGVQIQFNTGGTLVTGGVTVNTNDGSVTDRSGFTPSAKTVLSVGEYWRVSVSLANNSSGNTTCSGFIYPAVNTDASGTWVTTTTGSVTVWGAQLEASNYATSYIPTTSATVTRVADSSTSAQVTRAADVATMTGTNFSSWYRQDEGTFVATWDKIGSLNFQFICAASDGTLNNYINITHGSGAPSNNLRLDITSGGASQASITSVTNPSLNTEYRTAAAYKVNDFAISSNANTVQTDTSGTVPTADRLSIGVNQLANSGQLCGHILRIAYYPSRLSDATIKALSTP